MYIKIAKCALQFFIIISILYLQQPVFSQKEKLPYESGNPPVTREKVDMHCDASEDYVKNKEECDLMYEDVERNEAGDHWIGGVTPDEFVDADRESDLLYGELCTYNDGKWKNNKCEFDDDADELKYEKKLEAYHDTNPEKVKEQLDNQDKGQADVVKCDDGIIYDRDSTDCDEEGKGHEFVICNGVDYPKGTDCDDIEKNIE